MSVYHAVGSECPLCTGNVADTFAHVDQRTYYRCATCRLIFLQPDQRLTPLQEILRYQQHRNSADDPAYIAFLSRLANPLIARLPQGARGLDFGCGPAPVLSQIMTAAGFPTEFYDPLFHPGEVPLRARYDFVMCSEVIEHVHDPRTLLSTVASMLRDGGTWATMTTFFEDQRPFADWWYRRDPTHVCFYSHYTMAWVAAERGWALDGGTPNVSIFTVPGREAAAGETLRLE